LAAELFTCGAGSLLSSFKPSAATDADRAETRMFTRFFCDKATDIVELQTIHPNS
jgi:hypothetical protein